MDVDFEDEHFVVLPLNSWCHNLVGWEDTSNGKWRIHDFILDFAWFAMGFNMFFLEFFHNPSMILQGDPCLRQLFFRPLGQRARRF